MEGQTNKWDVIRAGVVLAAFVYLVVFLVRHYAAVKDATTVLGIVAPVFAGAFGVSLGYYTGRERGKTQGAADKEQAVRTAKTGLIEQIRPLVVGLEQRVKERILPTIAERLPSPQGERRFRLAPGEQLEHPLDFAQEDLEGASADIDRLKAILDAVAAQ
jgi:hypothetical protein